MDDDFRISISRFQWDWVDEWWSPPVVSALPRPDHAASPTQVALVRRKMAVPSNTGLVLAQWQTHYEFIVWLWFCMCRKCLVLCGSTKQGQQLLPPLNGKGIFTPFCLTEPAQFGVMGDLRQALVIRHHHHSSPYLRGAILNGQADVINAWLVTCEEPDMPWSGLDFNPFVLAAEQGLETVVTLLLAKTHPSADTLRSALERAATGNHIGVLRMLLSQPTTSDSKVHALHSAATGGHLEAVRLLVKEGADVHKGWSMPDTTALLTACTWGHLEVARFLIDEGADIHRVDAGGEGTLHLAAWGGSVELMTLLLDQGADPNRANIEGRTPLMVAVEEMHTDAAALLLDRGATPSALTDEGESALFFAVTEGSDAITALLLATGQTDVNATVDAGDGPEPLILVAARGDSVEVVELMLQHGADVTATDVEGNTALHEAAGATATVAPVIVKLLLEKGARRGARNGRGDEPLAIAKRNGRTGVVKALLSESIA